MKELLVQRKEANETELNQLVQTQQRMFQQLNAMAQRQAELQGTINELNFLITESEKKVEGDAPTEEPGS